MSKPRCEPADTRVECVMAWLLYGDGAICLYHQQPVVWKGRQ